MRELEDGDVIEWDFGDEGVKGTFVVKTGSEVDGGDIIVFSDDDERYCEVAPDTRKRYQKWGGFWIFRNPFYQFHPDDLKWFGVVGDSDD